MNVDSSSLIHDAQISGACADEEEMKPELPYNVTWVSSPLEFYVPGADECFGRCTACSTLFLPTDGASPRFTSVPRDTLTGPRDAMTQP